MLHLGSQVGGHEIGTGAPVGHHHDLGGAGDGVDADHPEDLLLGQRHPDVAGPRDEIDAGDARRAVGQGGDGLGASRPEDLVHARDRRRGQDGRGQAAVGRGRRADHQLAHPRQPGRDGGHQHRGGVGGAAAGDVKPGPAHRAGEELQAGRSGHVGEGLRGVEGADPGGRQLQLSPLSGRQALASGLQRGAPHRKRLALGGRPAVEPAPVLAQRGIPLCGHPGHDLLHHGPFFAQAGEVEPPPRKRAVQPVTDAIAPNRHCRPLPATA